MRIDSSRASASQIRPVKMLEAFKALGYDVSIVMGSAVERKQASSEIRRQINAGVEFDFLYSESSTMPTQLTEPNHFPISRSIDFGLFECCRNNDIGVGLFYRDIYWKYPDYRKIGTLKSKVASCFYRHDLKEYRRCLDILFVPSEPFYEVISGDIGQLRHEVLPPGCIVDEEKAIDRLSTISNMSDERASSLRLIYVGGVGSHYGLDGLLKSLANLNGVEVTLCVRQSDYAAYDKSREIESLPYVRVVHASGAELDALYDKSDIALMFFDPNPYQSIAIPFKTFEYISRGLPIISNRNTAAADFIQENQVGWILDNRQNQLGAVINEIKSDKGLLFSMSQTCLEVARQNTWLERARFVASQLTQ